MKALLKITQIFFHCISAFFYVFLVMSVINADTLILWKVSLLIALLFVLGFVIMFNLMIVLIVNVIIEEYNM